MAGILKMEYDALDLNLLAKYTYRDHWPSIVNTVIKFSSVGGGKCLYQLSDRQF
jgi:hypothetical protein